MILIDHNGSFLPVYEEKGRLITAVTAFLFNNGIIYHIGHENGDVDVFPVLSGTECIYLGNEVFLLPEIRTSLTTIDFQSVTLTEYGYLGTVKVADKTISLPQYISFDEEPRASYADLASPPEVPRPEFIPTGTPEHTYSIRMQQADLPGGQPVCEPYPRMPNAGPIYEDTPFAGVYLVREDAFVPEETPQETPEEEPMPF